MSRPRGRPARGEGLEREAILEQALSLLDEGGGQGLTVRALAGRLGVSPMSLYRHVGDHAGLLRALADRVYAGVLDAAPAAPGPREEIRALLARYHLAVSRHPQLALAIFATPEALAGATRGITDRLADLLATMTGESLVWRDILVDHAHGSGLAIAAHGGELEKTRMQGQYEHALDRLLDRMARPPV